MGNQAFEITTKILLLLLAAVSVYFLINIIRDPILAMRQERERKQMVINRLEKVREAQKGYKDAHSKYTGTWDSLMHFVKRDSMQVIKTIGDPNDTTQQIRRDTSSVLVEKNLFPDYPADSIQYAPNTGKRFKMDAGKVKLRGVEVPVFEVKDRKKINDKILKIGSMKKGTTTGNW